MNILFWDIDGTLIRTSKAGLYAFAQAAKEQWGTAVSFESMATAGMTDNYIARQIIESVTGRAAAQDEIDSLCRRYESLLPEQLAARQGLVLPEVANILSQLHGREGYKLLLLTGNSRQGAEIKLRFFELAKYFDFDRSAFSRQHERRADIAANALQIVEDNWGDAALHNIYVIGDTPHDIACGQSISAYTIAVATGAYSLEQLAAHKPWWGVAVLPATQAFVAKLAAPDAGQGGKY